MVKRTILLGTLTIQTSILLLKSGKSCLKRIPMNKKWPFWEDFRQMSIQM